MRAVNPFNQHGLKAKFNVTFVEESKLFEINNKILKYYGVKIDNLLVTEGRHNYGFLYHFCTFYHSNICHSVKKATAIKNLQKNLATLLCVQEKLS